MIKTNFHTHTHFCDGANSPREMVISAIEKGFTALGFSGHSYIENMNGCSLEERRLDEYYSQVMGLKEEFKDYLEIYCGLEQDVLSLPPTIKTDYLIGSVHNVVKNGVIYPIDMSITKFETIVKEVYDGSYLALAKDYFATVANVVDITNPTFIGHIDLISKFNERLGYSETQEYLEYAKKAVDKLLKTGVPFEINTGAMSRGYRTTPYPSLEILKMIKNGGGKIIFSSDCHKKEHIDYAFNFAEKIAVQTGFTEHYIITESGLKAEKLGIG